MKNIKKVSFPEVLEIFDSEHSVNEGSNDWARKKLQEANEKFKGIWWKAELSRREILNILLVWHLDGDLELIPPTGLTVLETKRRFKEIRDEYRAKSKNCYEKIIKFGQDPFSPIFLSTEPLRGYGSAEYERLRYRNNHLVHLDGLHSLIAWAVVGRLNRFKYYFSPQKVNAFIAGPVG